MTRDSILYLINHIPLTADPIKWVIEFRSILTELLPDVDRISMSVNFYGYSPRLSSAHNARPAVNNHVRETNGSYERTGTTSHVLRHGTAEEVIADMIRFGFPAHEYHTPHHITISHNVHVGHVILWSALDQHPVSRETIAFVEGLRSFLSVLLMDVAERMCVAKPQVDRLQHNLARILERTVLTPRERQVFLLTSNGFCTDDIASQLFVSASTIRQHLRKLRHKLGVTSIGALLETVIPDEL